MSYKDNENGEEKGKMQHATAYETSRKDALNFKLYDLIHIIKGTTFAAITSFTRGPHECPTTADVN